MSGVKKFISDTVIYGLSTIISRVLNFLLTPFIVRQFPNPSIFGTFTLMYAWSSFVNALLAFGMETTYFRFIHKVEPQDKQKVFNNSFIVILFTSIIFLITVLTFTDSIASWLSDGMDVHEYAMYVKYFAFILAADALAIIPFAKVRENGRPFRYAIIKLVNIVTYVSTSLVLIAGVPMLIEYFPSTITFFSWYQNGWIGYIFVANLIASAVTLIMLLPEISTFKFKPERKLISQMVHYSWPIILANISFIINENYDKMFFTKLNPSTQGQTDFGVYGAVSKIAIFLNLFITAFRLGAEPFFFSYAKEENAKSVYARIMEYFVIAMVIGMVAISANLDWLKYFVGSDESPLYWTGLFIVPFILFNFVLLGIYSNLSIWYKLSDQTRYALYISAVGAVSTIVLCYYLIPEYSYVGAVFATTVAYILMVGLSYFWGQKKYPIPYKTVKILAYLLIGVVLSWVCYGVLNSNFWLCNLVLIAFVGAVIYSERKMILPILKRRKSI
ncbi:polysaccharide biosynthesis C-terminal domain-containing protein [Sphingobacterium hungaricum]|uniref:Polysaccharide biosynthesis protein n=1 Tax=Sphingobacterium hungaricum TaxID=2082723 RepID=A0A928YQ08_9SPHI|nr:polysaccharide biosynthesis C-terminal domain-containing protein [Sphingobacterium hungaricum]MBE8713112.1 polysaccharide biosynthesis protein [Sphingobacterium hungaricum]